MIPVVFSWQTKPLESRMGRADLRLVRATNLSRLYREQDRPGGPSLV